VLVRGSGCRRQSPSHPIACRGRSIWQRTVPGLRGGGTQIPPPGRFFFFAPGQKWKPPKRRGVGGVFSGGGPGPPGGPPGPHPTGGGRFLFILLGIKSAKMRVCRWSLRGVGGGGVGGGRAKEGRVAIGASVRSRGGSYAIRSCRVVHPDLTGPRRVMGLPPRTVRGDSKRGARNKPPPGHRDEAPPTGAGANGEWFESRLARKSPLAAAGAPADSPR